LRRRRRRGTQTQRIWRATNCGRASSERERASAESERGERARRLKRARRGSAERERGERARRASAEKERGERARRRARKASTKSERGKRARRVNEASAKERINARPRAYASANPVRPAPRPPPPRYSSWDADVTPPATGWRTRGHGEAAEPPPIVHAVVGSM
jgi:hypothetical protein